MVRAGVAPPSAYRSQVSRSERSCQTHAKSPMRSSDVLSLDPAPGVGVRGARAAPRHDRQRVLDAGAAA